MAARPLEKSRRASSHWDLVDQHRLLRKTPLLLSEPLHPYFTRAKRISAPVSPVCQMAHSISKSGSRRQWGRENPPSVCSFRCAISDNSVANALDFYSALRHHITHINHQKESTMNNVTPPANLSKAMDIVAEAIRKIVTPITQ